jgi:hypothetical protein
MAKPHLLLNGKALDFSPHYKPTILKVKAFLDSQWGVYGQRELIKAGNVSKDAIADFQKEFPSYRLDDGFKGFLPLYGSPEALRAYQDAVRAHSGGKQ